MKRSAIVGLMAVLAPSAAAAATPAGTEIRTQVSVEQQSLPVGPRVGLVLSGGGARGAAHIGVLEILEERRIPIACIAGTSMGAVVGALYAAGYSPSEIEEEMLATDWRASFRDSPPRQRRSFRRKQEDSTYLADLEVGFDGDGFHLPGGLVSGQTLEFQLRRLLLPAYEVEDFDRLQLPFRAVATDLEDGSMVVMGDGDLADAVRASMAVPGALTPVERDGRLLADGGMVRNLPVDVARGLCADVVIAVDVGTAPLPREEIQNALDVSAQSILILTNRNVEESVASLGEDDILIRPELGDMTPTSFGEAEAAEAIAIGREEAASSRDLSELTISERAFASYLARQRRRSQQPIEVDYVDVRGTERVDPRQVRARVDLGPGDRVSVAKLRDDVDRIYEVGDFQNVEFHLEEGGQGTGLFYEVEEKSWGPHYLRLGLSVEDDLEGGNEYTVLLGHRLSQLNALGAEWRNHLELGERRRFATEWFQPLEFTGQSFLAPQFDVLYDRFDIYAGSRKLTSYERQEQLVRLDAGWQPGNHGELRAGIFHGRVKAEPSAPLPLPTVDSDQGGFRVLGRLDKVDSPYFPRDGVAATFEWVSQRPSLGGDLDYDRVWFSGDAAFTHGEDSFVLGFELGGPGRGRLPVHDQFDLGGFGRLSGLRREQLRDQYLTLGRFAWYRPFPWEPARDLVNLGVTLEMGNVWASGDDVDLGEMHHGGSVFVSADTVIGAVYLAAGYTDGGNTAIHFLLGRPF